MSTARRPPLPTTLAFVLCRKLEVDRATGEHNLLGTFTHLPVPGFPVNVRLAAYLEFTNGHGLYTPSFRLTDTTDKLVWEWAAQTPFDHTDPLSTLAIGIPELHVLVPAPGVYRLSLFLNGEEAAARTASFAT